jgi:hypothetical protein
MVDNVGASVSARRGSRSGQHPLGWRDAMDVIVRWRQLAEPNDQVCCCCCCRGKGENSNSCCPSRGRAGKRRVCGCQRQSPLRKAACQANVAGGKQPLCCLCCASAPCTCIMCTAATCTAAYRR